MGISWTKTVLIKLKSLSKQMQSFHVDSGNDPSVDDLVGAQKQRLRNRQAERFGGFQVDDQLELRWLPTGRLPGLAPFRIRSTKEAARSSNSGGVGP
jgi:hypothetical protein